MTDIKCSDHVMPVMKHILASADVLRNRCQQNACAVGCTVQVINSSNSH